MQNEQKGYVTFSCGCCAPLDVLFYLACQNTEALLHCSSNFVVSDCVQMIPQRCKLGESRDLLKFDSLTSSVDFTSSRFLFKKYGISR